MEQILNSYLKENYKYEIKRAVISADGKKIVLDIALNFVLSKEQLKEIKNKIMKEVLGLENVEINFFYEEILDIENSTKNFLHFSLPEVDSNLKALMKTIEWEETKYSQGTLEVLSLGQTATDMLNEKMSKEIEKVYREKLKIELKVVFRNHEEKYTKANEHLKKEELQANAQGGERKPAAAGQHGARSGGYGGNYGGNYDGAKGKSKTVVSTNPNKILGANLGAGKFIELKDIGEAVHNIITMGTVFAVEDRVTKKDWILATVLISDGVTSMPCKAFLKKEQWEHMKQNLEAENFVKVRGNVEWDNFSGTLVIMAKAIEKGEAFFREDFAEEKRVELHAHTKMSALDGVNEIKTLVKMAKMWGHQAVAITDHGVVQGFPEAYAAAQKNGIKILYGMEGYLFDDHDKIDDEGNIDYKNGGTNHIILLVKNQVGLKNLYKLVSYSHMNYFFKKPRLPKSILNKYREGLIFGSACEAGELFTAILNKKSEEEIKEIAKYYDYLEIQPLINNNFMIRNQTVSGEEELKEINKKIVALGKELNLPVVATCDTHYTDKEHSKYREILMAGMGYKDTESGGGLYFRTTDEMLEEFSYLGEDAHKVVVETTNQIANMIGTVKPIRDGKFPPKIEGSEEKLRETCETKARAIYGNPLPPPIRKRLDTELNSIINNGYAVLYISAKMLVEKSMEDGYLVGSRGSVGSSFAATMAGITEVNPLPPHYVCPQCKYIEWGDENLYDCGVDMPEKKCPECEAALARDGFAIRFETFLGFEGDKEPDIDLNFAGEYQGTAHKYVEEIFGAENVYKAGTIGTIASKTAYGFVMKYFEEKGIPANRYEIDRLTRCCSGVRRTTGQHPGGIIIVPRDREIYEFCPVNYPANDSSDKIVTTHFDYHSIDENLLKLDILGHDVPSMIRWLQEMTGVDPIKLPLHDEKVGQLFLGTESLNIVNPEYKFSHGSYGIPEFGTKFVRQMLDDTKPDKFGDLVRISGFSHGTNVWINNAQDFIRSGEATMKDAISTRDDIMNYLILKKLSNKEAFDIMESVRKGKGITEDQEKEMIEKQVDSWYIESCKKISYMFPRAHAVAYVMMSYRIAYFKVYYPLEFYAVYLTTKIADFNWEHIKKGTVGIMNRIESLHNKATNITKKEEDEITVLEICYEMFSRGFAFAEPVFGKSKALRFTVEQGKVLVPIGALKGIGETAGRQICEESGKKPFKTVEDIRIRGKANKTAIEALRESGLLEGLQETDQMSFFG